MANFERWNTGEYITASKLNNIQDFLDTIDEQFISASGSTISGNIIYKAENVDLSQADNGITTTTHFYPSTAIFTDTNDKVFARVEGMAFNDGRTGIKIYARNYNSDGQQLNDNQLTLTLAKDGTKIISLDYDAWRSALGLKNEGEQVISNAIFSSLTSTDTQYINTSLITEKYFGGSSIGGYWYQGADRAIFRNATRPSGQTFVPTLSMNTNNGSWNLGSYYNDNTLRMVYIPTGASDNSNCKIIYLNTDGVFSGKASGLYTPDAGGYSTDNFGNFIHRSTTSSNTWNIKKNDGTTNVFQVNFENGNTTILGALNVSGTLTLSNPSSWRTTIGAAAASHTHAAGDITSGTLSVARGGTGATTFASGYALIGNGTGSIQTRGILNLTTVGNVATGTSLITANTLVYWNGGYPYGTNNTESSISYVGTIKKGVWQGTPIDAAYIGSHTHSNYIEKNTTISITATPNQYGQITIIGVNKNTSSNNKLWSIYSQDSRLAVREFNPSNTNNYENYLLPAPTATAANEHSYNIWTTKDLKIVKGTVAAAKITGKTYVDVTIDYTSTLFTEIPEVVVGMAGGTGQTDTGLGSCSVMVVAKTKTSATIRKFSNDSASGNNTFGFSWIAIGK